MPNPTIDPVSQLRLLLDASSNTSEFLQHVQAAVESLYGETGAECPEGFTALDEAIEAFERAEE